MSEMDVQPAAKVIEAALDSAENEMARETAREALAFLVAKCEERCEEHEGVLEIAQERMLEAEQRAEAAEAALEEARREKDRLVEPIRAALNFYEVNPYDAEAEEVYAKAYAALDVLAAGSSEPAEAENSGGRVG